MTKHAHSMKNWAKNYLSGKKPWITAFWAMQSVKTTVNSFGTGKGLKSRGKNFQSWKATLDKI